MSKRHKQIRRLRRNFLRSDDVNEGLDGAGNPFGVVRRMQMERRARRGQSVPIYCKTVLEVVCEKLGRPGCTLGELLEHAYAPMGRFLAMLENLTEDQVNYFISPRGKLSAIVNLPDRAPGQAGAVASGGTPHE